MENNTVNSIITYNDDNNYTKVFCNGIYMGDESCLTSVICGCLNMIDKEYPIKCKEVYVYDIGYSYNLDIENKIDILFCDEWKEIGIPQEIIKLILNNDWDKVVERYED